MLKKKQTTLFAVLGAGLLGVWLWSPAPVAWSGPAAADGGLSATIGSARIQLLAPPGLIQIDGLDEAVDALFAELPTPEILAVYAEPRSWNEYRKGVNLEGPRTSLDFYAYIAAPALPPDETLDRRSFEQFKEMTRRYGGEMLIMDDQPRYMTYKTTISRINDGGRTARAEQITTLILVEGKIISLNVFSNDLNRTPSQFMPSALGWRDAYWKETRP